MKGPIAARAPVPSTPLQARPVGFGWSFGSLDPFRGAAGFRELLATSGQAMSWESSVERVSAIDEHQVLLAWRITAQGSHSGAPTEQRMATIMTVRNVKVTRTEDSSSVEQALE